MIIDEIKFNVNIVKKKQKKTYLRVEKNNINISTPIFNTKKTIDKINLDNKAFILKQYNKYKNTEDFVYYLGKKFNKIDSTKLNVDYESNIFYYTEKLFNKLTKNILEDRYKECFKNFKEKDKIVPLKIRKMKTRHGVCNLTKNYITLNFDLIMYDFKSIDYVIYHEFCHLVHPNHSSDFWNLVKTYVKNYRDIKKAMKEV
ncbi:MAG: M48 family metallopeptidase [Bacilli bacterium]